jgi:hypothetical protein
MCLYTNKHNPNTTTTTNTISTNTTATTNSGNVYVTPDFHKSPRVTWSHITLIDKVILQTVNKTLTTPL